MKSGRSALTVVILAAGQGTRMRSGLIKLLHPVVGRPMVALVADCARELRPERIVAVVGHQATQVQAALADSGCEFAMQTAQRGTGHAVLQAARLIDLKSTLLIVNGDLPMIRPSTLRALIQRHRRNRAALSVLSTELVDAGGYGRILRDDAGRFTRIVEHRDATPGERRVREINAGIYCADAAKLLQALRRLRPDNAQGEYYITDAVESLIRRGESVQAICHPNSEEILGVNTRRELAFATQALYARKSDELLDRGVTILDPARTWIDPRARIGQDTTIYPDVLIEGATVIARECTIRSGSRLRNCKVGQGATIKDHCLLDEAQVGDRAEVGPFAHLRPGSRLGVGSKVGNFVELKQTRLGRGSKASHLAYLGDATIGDNCNIGAGTITCNYDGSKKHRTVLDDGVFVGSDSQLVAPVRIRKGAYVAAGSTVVEDVPAEALAIGRGRQVNILGWVKRRRKK